MDAWVLGIVRIPATRDQIFLVQRERFGDGQRSALVDGVSGLTTRQRTGQVNRLPIGKDVWRARGLEIVGDRDALDPLGTGVGDAHGPRAAARVAPVAEMDAGADGRPVRFLPHRELATGGGAFEFRVARLGQEVEAPVSGKCPKYRSGAPWSAIERYRVKYR